MTRFTLPLLLAAIAPIAAPPAQSNPCLNLEFRQVSGWINEWAWYLDWHDHHAKYFTTIELVPVAGGVACMLLFHTFEGMHFYQEEMIWRQAVPGCEQNEIVTLGCYWDDRHNLPQPGDQLRFPTVGGPLVVDLRANQVGVVLRPFPGIGVPVVQRADPSHWNYPLWRPNYWAVLIAPQRGWW